MPRFTLVEKGDGYWWMCPTCKYAREKAYVMRPISRGGPEEPTHLRAGMRHAGLVACELPECLNCLAREDAEIKQRLVDVTNELRASRAATSAQPATGNWAYDSGWWVRDDPTPSYHNP